MSMHYAPLVPKYRETISRITKNQYLVRIIPKSSVQAEKQFDPIERKHKYSLFCAEMEKIQDQQHLLYSHKVDAETFSGMKRRFLLFMNDNYNDNNL